jgi:hypothetical protein
MEDAPQAGAFIIGIAVRRRGSSAIRERNELDDRVENIRADLRIVLPLGSFIVLGGQPHVMGNAVPDVVRGRNGGHFCPATALAGLLSGGRKPSANCL